MKEHIKSKLKVTPDKQRQLQLTNGRLKFIPTELQNFRNLKYLDFFGNNINSVPDWFFQLSELENLSFNKNKFEEIPSLIFLLPNLNSFTIRENKISEIDRQKLENLLKIKKIDISYNNIQFLPNVNTTVIDTEEFYCKGNKLTEFPHCIRSAKKIRKIILSENNITSFEDFDFELLTEVEELDLSYNNITYLPSSIGNLKKLKFLNLAGNKLQNLPEEFEGLVSLEKLEFSGNPIARVPVEIEAQGVQGVINYYLSLGNNVKLFEAKLLIVGQGSVGKTFLMNRIIRDETPDVNTTEGIDINAWKISTNSSDNFRINVWDFGGQEIYHSTHQFFLTKRSLYLLVWEARTDQHLTSFDYWLNAIRLLSNESPIIMVLNKIDERIISIDEKSLKEKFKNIVSFHQVSAFKGTNIAALIEEIKERVDILPLIGDRLPKVWLDIRDELERINENSIKVEEYLQICNRHGLSNKRALFLSQYFHDLGVFLHFQDNLLLRQIVFLKPEWATNAVYKIIDSKNIVSKFGEFSLIDIDEILESYSEGKLPFIIELMKKFELCFSLNDNTFLIPELLRPIKIEFNWDFTENLRFEYHYDFMPAGILARFIVRTHGMIFNKKYWKNGVIIQRDNTRALVTSDQYSRKIQIWIKGENKAFLLEILRNELESIHNTLNYPNVAEKIPCNCYQCDGSHTPHLFNYNFVKEVAVSNSFKTIPCEMSFKGVNVLNLLGLYQLTLPALEDKKEYDLESLLLDVVEISSRLLERKFQKKIEDLFNDDITDLLRTKGYNISDQTRSGKSSSGNSPGELDIMIRKKNGTPLSIIECFRLESCGSNNTVIVDHVDKLLNSYDTHGLSRNFIIVFSEAKKFSKLWDNYVSYLNKINENINFNNTYPLSGFSRREDLLDAKDLKIGIARHERQGSHVEVVHIIINFKKNF